MCKNYSLKRTGGLIGRLWLLLALFFVSVNVSADDVTYIDVELDTKYEIPYMQQTYYRFEAPKSGVLTAICTTTKFVLWDNPECEGQPISNKFSYVDGGQKTEMQVEEGKVYYTEFFSFNREASFTLTMGEAKLELVKVEPATDQVFDITSAGGRIDLYFTMSARVGTSILKCGGKTAEVEAFENASGVCYELKNTIFEWLQNGEIKKGDPMTLTISDVRAAADESIKYGTDGTLVLNYTVPAMPAMLVEEVVPEEFLSYWIKDNEAGKVKLTFDTDLMPQGNGGESGKQTASASINFGSAEASDYYSEEVPVTVDGKTLTVDLTGKLRTPENMVPSGTNYGVMNLQVRSVMAADGSKVYSPGQGTFGTFYFTIDYTQISNDITADFTPASGTSLQGVDKLEYYLSDKSAVIYSGVKFDYTKGGEQKSVIVANSEITETPDPAPGKGVTLKLNVPADVQGAADIYVSLADMQCTDGIDHDLTGKFDMIPVLKKEFEPVTVSPESESILTDLKTIELTFNDEVFVNADIEKPVSLYDKSNRVELTGATVAKSETNKRMAVITLPDGLEDTHSYDVVVTEGVFGNAEYNETGHQFGLTNPALTYHYLINEKVANADVVTDPLDGSVVDKIENIIVTSDESIGWWYGSEYSIYLINSAGAYVAEGKMLEVTELPEGDRPEKGLLIKFDPAITAPDTYTMLMEDSVIIFGEQFETSPNAPMSFTYIIEGEPEYKAELKPVNSDPVDGSEVEGIRTINLAFDENLVLNKFVKKPVTVYDRENRTVVTKGVVAVDVADSKTLTVVLDAAIVEDGTYTVEIAGGTVGDEEWGSSSYLKGNCNSLLSYTYKVVKATPEIPEVTTDPADGSTVEELHTIVLTFAKDADAAPSFSVNPELLDADNNVVATATADFGDDFDALNVCKIVLDSKVTTPGTYTLNVPEGVFIINGDNSPAMKFTYTVGTGTGIADILNGDAAETFDVYTVSGVCILKGAGKSELNKLGSGLYIINGKKVMK